MDTLNEYEPADPAPDANRLKLIAALRQQQILAIDAAIMDVADQRWKKVAFIAGSVMCDAERCIPGVPDVFYAQRVSALVSQGRLAFRGDLSRMRYSEVRLSNQPGDP